MTTANKITIGRILLIPVFVLAVLYYLKTGKETYRYLALASFLAAAVSDAVDGFIARRFNQRSELGAILDPLADKLLLVSGVVLLTVPHEGRLPDLPLWLSVTVIGRDLLLLLCFLISHYMGTRLVFQPHWTGKVATVLLMGTILLALLRMEGAWLSIWTWSAVVCTAGSGVVYGIDGIRQLSTLPASAPSSKQ